MIKHFLSLFSVCLLAASVASAGTITIVSTPNVGNPDDGQGNVPLDGTITNDIILTTDPGESLLSTQILFQLDSGQVYDHNFGSDTPPNAALLGSFPNLAQDSFISAGDRDNSGPTPTIVGRSDKLGGPGGTPASFESTGWDALWGPSLGQDTEGAQDYLVARITLSPDANGSFLAIQAFGTGGDVPVQLPIINGQLIPEPATFGLGGLALAGLGFRRRR